MKENTQRDVRQKTSDVRKKPKSRNKPSEKEQSGEVGRGEEQKKLHTAL